MATYYVDGVSGNDGAAGSSGAPWKTLGKAYGAAAGGDTVRVRTATYYETLELNKAGLTFEADTGHTPTIDGRYSPALFGAAGYKDGCGANLNANTLPALTAANAALGNWVYPGSGIKADGTGIAVKLNATGSKIKGFVIRNIPGRAIGFTANNTVAENCIVDFCYGGAIVFDSACDGGVLRGTTVTRSSVKQYDPCAPGAGPDAVATTVIIKGRNCIAENNTVCYNCGEGISADKGSIGVIIRGNTIHTNNHWSLGFNYAAGAKIYNNTVYWCDNLAGAMGKDGPGDLFTCGSERADPENPKEAYSPDIQIYNNLLVGGKRALLLGGEGRPVQFVRGYIGYNTLVGYEVEGKVKPVLVWAVLSTAQHQNTLVENNIVVALGGRQLVSYQGGGSVTWRHNLANKAVPNGMNGAGTIVTAQGAATLVNPGAAITGTFDVKGTGLPNTATSFNAANYDLTSSSQAIGRGSDRSNISGLTNPGINYDRTGAGRTDFNAAAGRYYDMGSREYDASSPPVDPKTITASFNRSPGSGNAPLTVAFTDTSQTTGGASITGWLWSFGDGGTSSLQNPTHVYAAAGTYTTTLTITDSVNGLSSSFTGGSVTVNAVATGSVTARFTRAPAAGQAGVTSFAFTDTSTETGDGNINEWEWDFRDGGTSSLQNPTHVYAAAGTYRPRLTVRDTVRGYSSVWTGPDTVVTAAPPAASIEAMFAQDATAGQSPLTVAFTDTSLETGGAAITGWAWEFGDGGTSAIQNPTHVYAAAGVYTPQLTVTDSVNDLVDIYIGQAIAVSAPPPPPAGGDVVLRQARAALNTADGNQTFTQSGLGGITPKSARFIVTAATADGTAADGELFCYGVAAGGAEWAACIAAEHGAANTNAARRWTDDACILLIDANGSVVMRATFVGFTADGVTVNIDWTGTPAAYLATVVFGAGTEYEAWVGTAALGAVGSSMNVSCGFAADVVRGVATWGGRDTGETDAALSLGLAHRLGGQCVLERSYYDGEPDALNKLRLFDGDVFHCRYNTPARGQASVTEWGATGFTVGVRTGDINSTGLVMAERFGEVGSRVALVSSAIVAGSVDYSLDWDPQYVEHLISQATAWGSVNDHAKGGTVGVHSVTADGEFSNEVSGENGSATTNEQSLSDNQMIVVGHTGTTVAAGATTLGTGKYAINYATAPGTAVVWPSLAVELGQATGGGGDYLTAGFVANVTSGPAPLRVRFTDLSAGTDAVVSWLWDFGDGATSTEQNPVHTYLHGGVYTVALTVGDGTLTGEESKADYIVVIERVAREVVVGPWVLLEIDEASTPLTYRDPTDEDNAGYLAGGLQLGALRISGDPVEPGALSDEVSIWYDATADKVYLKRPDGTVKEVG